MKLDFITIMLVVGGISLVGAFVESAVKSQQARLAEQLAKVEQKLDLLLDRTTPS